MAVLPPPAPGCASCAARDAVIAEQARVLEEQVAAIGELRADVVALAAEVAELRRRLGRNSGNSSMAPSADDLPGRAPPPGKPKRGGGRKPGKQPGAPGSHLAWSASPDERVPHFPAGPCACGADLAARG
jgi:transposase